jgi:hypothetical protein
MNDSPGHQVPTASGPHGRKTTHHTQKAVKGNSPREVAAPEIGGYRHPKQVAAPNRNDRPRSAEITKWPHPKYAHHIETVFLACSGQECTCLRAIHTESRGFQWKASWLSEAFFMHSSF